MEDTNPQMQTSTGTDTHVDDSSAFQGNTMIPKVRKKRRSVKNSTAFQMQVESNTDNDFYDFDRKRIINSLMLHCDLTEEESFEIAKTVELRLMSSGQKTVSSGFIREIVNNILFEKGYNKQLEQYYNIITSLDTIESVLTDHNKENSNTGFSPESINLTLAGSILKSYALRTLHSSNISKAHKIGDIHIHDSDFTGVRPYAFDGEKSVVAVNKGNGFEEISIEKLYKQSLGNKNATRKIEHDGNVSLIFNNKIEVKDKNSNTDLISITEIIENKEIFEIELENGAKIFVTGEHPCIVIKDGKEVIKRADEIIEGESFYAN